jgi:hypothetical protein
MIRYVAINFLYKRKIGWAAISRSGSICADVKGVMRGPLACLTHPSFNQALHPVTIVSGLHV